MPIEFRCSRCNRLLRVGDDSAGRQAQCPECGSLSTVPVPGAGTPAPRPPIGTGSPFGVPAPTPPAAIPRSTEAGGGFGAAGSPLGGAAESPFAAGSEPAGSAGESENPYQSPTQYGPVPQGAYAAADPFAASRVSAPATALIVVGSLQLALQVLSTILNLMSIGGVFGPPGPQRDMPPIVFTGGFVIGTAVVSIAVSILIIVGALKMKRLESYAWAMTSAILAVIPCFSGICCLLELPFGIWALVVINDRSVRAAFRS